VARREVVIVVDVPEVFKVVHFVITFALFAVKKYPQGFYYLKI